MRVLAVDPGDFSGWVAAEVLVERPWLLIEGWGEVGEEELQRWLSGVWRGLAAGRWDTVICENFRPVGGRMTWHPSALETVGALRFMTGHHAVPYVLQWVAASKAFSTREKLAWFRSVEGGGVGKGARDDDALSALRHLVLWRFTACSVPVVGYGC